MISPALFWFLSLVAFLAAFIFIMWRERDVRFFFYFVFGSLTAFFVFDVPSSILGYYGYSVQHYLIIFFTVPLSMTLAEGLCVAIAIYMYERLPWLFGLLKRK